jgi:tRNA pseudouridine55 synthase
VEIFSITVDRISLPEATFRISCSKGTYIRSICADAGEKLGCGACLTELRRTASGPFTEKSAFLLDELAPEHQRQMRGYDIPFLAGGDMVKFVTAGQDLVAVAKVLYGSGEMPTIAEKTQMFQILRVFNEI